jgi:hypothetical protein
LDLADMTRFSLLNAHLPWCAHAASCETCKDESLQCECTAMALTDGGKAQLLVDAARHELFTTRREHLDALKDGFQATTAEETDATRGCHDFSAHLNVFTPTEIALRLRGREVGNAAAAWEEFKCVRFERADGPCSCSGCCYCLGVCTCACSCSPTAVCTCDACKYLPPTAREFETHVHWFECFVLGTPDAHGVRRGGLDESKTHGGPGVRDLLRMITCLATVKYRPPGAVRADEDKITILVHREGARQGYLPTVSTCARTLYLPVVADEETFVAKLKKALVEDAASAARIGGAGFGFE